MGQSTLSLSVVYLFNLRQIPRTELLLIHYLKNPPESYLHIKSFIKRTIGWPDMDADSREILTVKSAYYSLKEESKLPSVLEEQDRPRNYGNIGFKIDSSYFFSPVEKMFFPVEASCGSLKQADVDLGLCPLCSISEEGIHIFLQCPVARILLRESV